MTISSALRVKLSLADIPVRRLIVCLGCGDRHVDGARGALGNLVSQQILETCAPSPSDIHNPDENRMHARDAFGRARPHYSFYRREQYFKSTGSVRRHSSTRGPQTWDSERVVDYMGVWCDRLLLGEHTNPSRCALLEPRVPPIMMGESLERVLQVHRNFKSTDLLFVFSSSYFPFGVVRLTSFNDSFLSLPTAGGTSAYPHNSLSSVVGRLTSPPANNNNNNNNTASALLLGIGDTYGPLAPLTAEEKVIATTRIVPLASFVSALWTVNPAKAKEYLESNPKESTRLWRTMQSSLLSTRDTAVLRAHASGLPLDARMSQRQITYLAETLLSRLFPHNE